MRPIPPRWFSSLSSPTLAYSRRYPPPSFYSSSSSSSSSSVFRDESTKEPRPRVEAERNETRFSLIRSTSYSQSVVPHTHTHTRDTCADIHAYIHAAFPLARVLLRLVRAGPTLVLPFSSLLALSSAGEPGEVSHRPLLILSRRSTASIAVSLALIRVCRFCVSHPLPLRARSPTVSLSLSLTLRALSLEQPINSVGRRRVRTTILSLSSHRPTVLTPI